MATVRVYAKSRTTRCTAGDVKEFVTACGQAILPILTPFIIVGGIVLGLFTATESSVSPSYTRWCCRSDSTRKWTGPKLCCTRCYDTGALAAIALFCVGTASVFGLTPRLLPYPGAGRQTVDRLGTGGLTGVGSFTVPHSSSSAASSMPSRRSSSSARRSHRSPIKVHMHPIHSRSSASIAIAYRPRHSAVWTVPDDRLLDRRHHD